MFSKNIVLQIASCLALMVGVWQVLFSLVKFGKLSWILSDVLVSAANYFKQLQLRIIGLQNTYVNYNADKLNEYFKA